jgi:UDP-N-acetylglucosamine--N-acetylmuramyl-(pentapeptide) pyrophosphoryl-undecaprenol N-acetylglucosamine transferase
VRTVLTGDPVREDIVRVPQDRETLAKEGRVELDLDERRRTVLIFGGSQGALHIDRAALGACRLLGDRPDIQMVLITGPAHLEVIRRGLPAPGRPDPGAAGAPPQSAPPEGASGDVLAVASGPSGLVVRLVGYLERMELAYACADLVVSRAGATTVAEISVCGLPALLVPYPYATARHQEHNARAMQRAGAASVIDDDQLSAHGLAERITTLLDDTQRMEAMRERSRAFGKPDAASHLADVVVASAGTAP